MMHKITNAIQSVNEQGHPAFVAYIMAGDGGLDKLESQIVFLQDAGVTAIEIGIPFSDPVADGPVIQAAGLRAIAQKSSLATILRAIASFKTDITIPLIIMSYLNPIYHMGIPAFIKAAKLANISGVIIPDVPYEHFDILLPACKAAGIAYIPLVSLSSDSYRMQLLSRVGDGFVYATTVNGTTGQRQSFNEQLEAHLDVLTEISPLPVLCGFGVNSPEHVKALSKKCNGVIVGSKIVDMLHNGQTQELKQFIQKSVLTPCSVTNKI